MENIDPGRFGLNSEINFAQYWALEEPFLKLKTAMYEALNEGKDFHYDYPYESMFNRICAMGFVKEAHEKDSFIEIRYGWEPLDSSNIIMHSCRGFIVHPMIYMEGNSPGFLIELEEGDGEPTISFFEYRKIFWVERID